MKIIIATSVSFPFGMASTNRIMSYSIGFKDILINSKVLCLFPDNDSLNENKEIPYKSSFNGIEYEYLWKTRLFVRNKFIRYIKYLLSFFYLGIYFYKEEKEQKIDSVIFYSNSNILYLFEIFILSKIFKFSIISERSEYPSEMEYNGVKKLYKFLFLKFYFKLFDGMIVETEILSKYFSKLMRSKCKRLLIPATSNPTDIIDRVYERIINEKYIFYSGTIAASKKEGIEYLIDAMNELKNKNVYLKCFISGSIQDRDYYNKLLELVKKSNLQNEVVFLGYIDRTTLLRYMTNASILVQPKENIKITTGGLPSKVIEYLFTGVPVITTNISELEKYLTNNIDVLFVRDKDYLDISEKILFLLNNQSEALRIGENGYKTAFNCFYYKKYIPLIETFILQFKNE